ncbi:MAG: PhzF family phenazine biosynthesis protein [Deltaproteobacteria bacterium]|jgi:PhzF family phenazine biosynthesis protein|nr:PhzF family phenazine biosynthesis protein [Deltaproteobacteria bacterium]
MELKIFQIDAFANRPFEGNPAAVCPLQEWLSDQMMQSIAEENNLSETAFFVPQDGGFHIRWFTPSAEVDLCGHATLATAFVLYELLGYRKKQIAFHSRSGLLTVVKREHRYVLDFPAQPPSICTIPDEILQAFKTPPRECFKAEDYLVVFESESAITSAHPDLEILKKLALRGLIITAPSQRYDFVARFFAPKYGIPEDPVTGSAFTQLAPYWAKKLGKNELKAKQLSKRGGEVGCQLKGDRVLISGGAVKFMEGTLTLEEI